MSAHPVDAGLSNHWKCRVCGFDRYYRVTVSRGGGKPNYETSFHACSKCTTMFENPARFNEHNEGRISTDVRPSQVFRIKAK